MPPTILLTRPLSQADRFANDCRARIGHTVAIEISPVLEIVLRRVTSAPLPHTMLIFSSENAVRAFGQTYKGTNRTAYCVGDRTARAAETLGFHAISAHGTASDLIALIMAKPPSAPLLYLHGDIIRVDIAKRLSENGYQARAEAVYGQEERPLSHAAQRLLHQRERVLLPIFSPRSAEVLSARVATATAPLHIVALSDNVAASWWGPMQDITIAKHPSGRHMLDSIATILSDTLP